MIKDYIKKYEGCSIIVSILMICLSLFLMFKPLESLEVFTVIFAIIILLSGLGYLISYFTISKKSRLFSIDLLLGLVTIISGIMLLVYKKDVINVFPIILGIWIIISNLFKLQLSINLSLFLDNAYLGLVLITILMIVFGLLLIINPFASFMTITVTAGTLLLITEVINLIESIYVIIKLNKVKDLSFTITR
jgi:uncharacterized membrane protein HdeD (DUF308 family)